MNPVPGHGIGTPFGRKGSLWSLGFHTGLDIPADQGTPIVAAQAGRVIAANAYDRSYGYKVIILNDAGEQIWYCHMPKNKAKVSVGQRVAEGQPIGVVGATGNVTGPHLHIERRVAPYNFAAANFRDPAPIVNAKQGKPDKMDPASYYIGAKGDHVIWLGQRLLIHGYPKKYKVTDTYTASDSAAVKWFQEQQGWRGKDADGVLGNESLRRLALEPAKPSGVDLTNWKLTLPTGVGSKPTEVLQPQLTSYKDTNFQNTAKGLDFRAPCNGVTTSNSGYPRCELRQMTNNGTKLAAWSNVKDDHSMLVQGYFKELPKIKQEAVIAQIHDDEDDVCMVRLESKKLIIESQYAPKDIVLDSAYKLGTEFVVAIDADPDGITISYAKTPGAAPKTYHIKKTGSKWYFKAGIYTQASSKVPKTSKSYGTGAGASHITKLEVTPA